MEQASVGEVSSATITPEITPEIPKPSFLRRARDGLAITAIAAVALVAGLKSGQDSADRLPQGVDFPGKISGTDSSRTVLNTFPNEEKALADANKEDMSSNGSVSVTSPTSNAEKAFTNFYTDFGRSSQRDVPRLREVVNITDEDLFRPELEENPNVYPFSIYNTTQYPLDIRFFDYSLKAVRLWLNDIRMRQDGEINIGGHTDAKIEPMAVPHAFIMTNSYPDTLNKDYYSKATTRKYPDYLSTVFMVRENPSDSYDGPFKTDLPFRKRGIATEVCNSLIDIYGTKAALGAEAVLDAQREYWEKPDSQLGSDYTAHEQVCNALGGTITAIYEGGQAELHDYRSRRQTPVGLTSVPRMDLSIADRQIPQFFTLKRQALARESHIITNRNSGLPTVEWYKQNER